MAGPDYTCSKYLTCDACELDQRFVEVTLDNSVYIDGFDYSSVDYTNLPDDVVVLSSIKCESCSSIYDGCSKCGSHGLACEGCL